MAADMCEHTFRVGPVTINYAEGPASGAPLVLLHGGSARWQMLESLVPYLASRWRLFMPDLRGHGQSAWTPNHYSLTESADDICGLLAARVGEPALVFGQSWGGMVALMLAARCPRWVRAVAVGDSPLSRDSWIANLARDRIAAWRDIAGGQRPIPETIEILKDSPTELPGRSEPVRMREVMGEHNPVYGWVANDLYPHDPAFLTMLLEAPETMAAGYEMDALLPAIRCPVLLLQADPAAGGLMTDADVERAKTRLLMPSHARLAGVGHVLVSHSDQVARELISFFEAVGTL